PDDGRRRFVLYFPSRVLVHDERGARWVEFAFRGLPPPTQAWRRPRVPPVLLEADGDDLAPGVHASKVAEGTRLLAAGDLVSLVLSQTFRRRVQCRAADAFSALR